MSTTGYYSEHEDLEQLDLLQAPDVMKRFGYTNRAAFFQFVHANGVPHIRFNARRIMFDPAAIDAWLDKRRVGDKP